MAAWHCIYISNCIELCIIFWAINYIDVIVFDVVPRGNMIGLLWILVFALSLVGSEVTSQPCQRLFMQGLDNIQLLPYAKLSGLYSRTNITIDKFPTYRHERHQNEFLFYNGTRRVLAFGQGFVVAQTNGRLPRNNVTYPFSDLINGWRIYQPASKRYMLLYDLSPFMLAIVMLQTV